jgi:hypothetical protein
VQPTLLTVTRSTHSRLHTSVVVLSLDIGGPANST